MVDNRLLNICFHGIGEPERDLEPGEAPYWVAPDMLYRILDLTMDLPSVRISFDDGNTSDHRWGMTALIDRKMTATFFVLAGRLAGRGSLNAGQVRELDSSGMTIGTHGMDHRSWRGMDAPTRTRELILARSRLAEVVGHHVDEAALPMGRYDRRLLADLRRLGYRRVHTSDRRPARANSWLQPRFSVRAVDTIQTIRSMVTARQPPAQRAKLATLGLVKRLR